MQRRQFLKASLGTAAAFALPRVARAEQRVYLPIASRNTVPEPDWVPEVPLRDPVWWEWRYDMTFTLNEGDVVESRAYSFLFSAPDGLLRLKWSMHYVVPMPPVYQIERIIAAIMQGPYLGAPELFHAEVSPRSYWAIEAHLPLNNPGPFAMCIRVDTAPCNAIDLPPEDQRPYYRFERWA